MLKQSVKYFLSVLIISALYPFESSAQVVPDNTLGEESSKINSIGELREFALKVAQLGGIIYFIALKSLVLEKERA